MFTETVIVGYQPCRAISTPNDSDLTATTSDWVLKPAGAVKMPQKVNAVQIIFDGTAVANATLNWKIYAYKTGGPAEYVAEGTATLGLQQVDGAVATRLYADTISITAQKWLKTLVSADADGNDRISKIAFDLCGYENILVLLTGGTATTGGAYYSFF